MGIKSDIKFRVYLAFIGICLFGVAIIIKAALIQVNEGPALKKLAKELHTKIETLKADRGNIYAEDGALLSSSIPEFELHVDFSTIDSVLFAQKIDSLCWCMAQLFTDKTQEQYKEDFVHAYENEEGYYTLRRQPIKYNDYQKLRNFPIFNKSKNIGGLIVKPIDNRETPFDRLASRTIGAVRDSNASGLESAYDSYLKGKNGRQVVQKSLKDVWIPVDGSQVDPHNGKDVVTTLDINMQDVADHVLRSILAKYECVNGTCIVMEVKTGKIRTLVNLGRRADGTYDELLNYALVPSEPGSTFKLVTLLSLLNDKYITVDNMVDAEGGRIRFANRIMRDSHYGLGYMPIWEAYAHSSNAAMAKLAHQYYKSNPQKYVDHLLALHLHQPTGIDLPGEKERPTRIRKPGDAGWSATSLPWMATGYEVMITPMHTCMLYNAIANGGNMMRPYLVSAVREYGKELKTIEPQVITKVGDTNVVAQLKRCMRAVVTTGTAKGIESPFFTMAGKTGTAQVSDGEIKYTDGVYQGSFVGFFPAETPKYTICVVIRTKPHSAAYYGGAIAAPVFRMIADKVFSATMGSWEAPLDSLSKGGSGKLFSKMATTANYKTLLNAIRQQATMPGDEGNAMMQLTTDSMHHITVQPAKIYRGIMPDVKGMGLKDAVFMLEAGGMQVQVMGKGKVQAQSVQAGTRVTKGDKVVLQLS